MQRDTCRVEAIESTSPSGVRALVDDGATRTLAPAGPVDRAYTSWRESIKSTMASPAGVTGFIHVQQV
jgi:hypothetical protein